MSKLTPPQSGLNINPSHNQTVVFYWDELHNKKGEVKESGRMITAMVRYDYETGEVSYGASVFHKQSKQENFVKVHCDYETNLLSDGATRDALIRDAIIRDSHIHKQSKQDKEYFIKVHYDDKTGEVSYGPSVYHKQSQPENFVKRDHRKTAKARLEKRPAKFTLELEVEASKIRRDALNELGTDQQLFQDALSRILQSQIGPISGEGDGEGDCDADYVKMDNLDRTNYEIVKEIIVESKVRDYVLSRLRREVRKHIALPGGTKGERLSNHK